MIINKLNYNHDIDINIIITVSTKNNKNEFVLNEYINPPHTNK